MEIVDRMANAEEALVFIKERDYGIKHPQPGLDDDPSKGKHKKNSKGGKGKKTKTEEVLSDLPDKNLDKCSSSSRGKGDQPGTRECFGKP